MLDPLADPEDQFQLHMHSDVTRSGTLWFPFSTLFGLCGESAQKKMFVKDTDLLAILTNDWQDFVIRLCLASIIVFLATLERHDTE